MFEALHAEYPWISLNAVGLLRGALLVTVETPCDTRADTMFTSVNVLVPAAFVQQRAGWSLDDLILIEDAP
ncbi:hypothetical protein WME91_34230 [Sorangium sp. So ce269]